MNKTFNIINAILILLVLVGDVLYLTVGGLAIKSVTSAGFVLIGVVNLVYVILNKQLDLKFPIIMLIGLTFAMLGDIILEIEFIIGAALFAIGHLFFFVSYCFIQKFKWVDLAYGAAIFVPAVLFITLAPIFDFGGILMELVCVVYAVIISCMVGKSISNFVSKRNTLNIVAMVGSFLFFFSDLMLLLNVFGDLPRVVDVLCLVTYYPAECLLGYSIMLANKAKTENNKQNGEAKQE